MINLDLLNWNWTKLYIWQGLTEINFYRKEVHKYFFFKAVIHVLCHVTLASVSPGRIKKIFDRNVCKVIIQRPWIAASTSPFNVCVFWVFCWVFLADTQFHCDNFYISSHVIGKVCPVLAHSRGKGDGLQRHTLLGHTAVRRHQVLLHHQKAGAAEHSSRPQHYSVWGITSKRWWRRSKI